MLIDIEIADIPKELRIARAKRAGALVPVPGPLRVSVRNSDLLDLPRRLMVDHASGSTADRVV